MRQLHVQGKRRRPASFQLIFSNAGIKTNAIIEREHPVLIDITMGGHV